MHQQEFLIDEIRFENSLHAEFKGYDTRNNISFVYYDHGDLCCEYVFGDLKIV